MQAALRRGITPVVAIALLLGMTVAASGGAYAFISQAQQSAQEDASSALATEVAVRGLRCDDAAVEATLKNTGDTALSDTTLDAYLYRDGTLVTTSEEDVSGANVLQPNGLSTVSLPFILTPGTRYTVELRFSDSDVSVERTCQARLRNLAGYWDFETKFPGEVQDAARDNDGTFHNHEKNGTLNNFAFDADSGWISGSRGKSAVTFDGTDDYITFGALGDAAEAVSAAPFAIEAWWNPKAFNTGSGWPNYIDFGPGSRFNTRAASGPGRLVVHWHNESGSRICKCSTTNLEPGSWNHVLFQYDGQTLEFYVNGVLEDSEPSTDPGEDIGNTITVYGSNGIVWAMDDFRLYNRTFTEQEISALESGQGVDRGNLTAEWTFDEGNGTVAHDTSKWVDGKVRMYSGRFDGDDDYVEINDASITYKEEFTWTVWVKRAADKQDEAGEQYGDRHALIFDEEPGHRLEIDDSNDGTWWIQYYSGGDSNRKSTGTQVPKNKWTHLAVAYSDPGNYVRLYQNGEEVLADESVELDSSGSTFRFGDNFLGQDRKLNGSLDDIRIYDTALSADQVAALHDATD